MSKKFYISEQAENFCKENNILDIIQSINPASLSFYSDKDTSTLLAECDGTIIKKTLRDIMSEVYGWPKAKIVEEYLIDAILEEVPICLVKKEEKGSFFNSPSDCPTSLTKRDKEWNLKKGYMVFGKEECDEKHHIPEFDKKKAKTEYKKDRIDPLGCYVHSGIIFLFVDKIYESCKEEDVADLIWHPQRLDNTHAYFWSLLHKVMLHEYIHAIFHTDEMLEYIHNVDKHSKNWISDNNAYDEESLDNALLIYSYIKGASDALLLYTMDYITQQPSKYRASLEFMGLNSVADFDKKGLQLLMDENRKKLVEYIRKMIVYS